MSILVILTKVNYFLVKITKFRLIYRRNVVMTVFDRIKELGKRRGYNISQIETKLGLGTNSIYNWKKRTPTADNLAKVAKLLHTSTDYLLGLSDDPDTVQNDNNDMTKNQKLIAHSIDPDVTDEEREIIIGMVKEAMKFRRRL